MRQGDDKEAGSRDKQTPATEHWLLARTSKEADDWSNDYVGYFITAQYHSYLETVQSEIKDVRFRGRVFIYYFFWWGGGGECVTSERISPLCWRVIS